MLKEGVIISFNNHDIIEKTALKFGNGAHVVVSKRFLNKKVKIVAGKSKILKNKQEIIIDFSEAEIFNRKTSKFGTGCHVIIPKEYSGKDVKVIIKKGGKNE